MDRLWIRQEMNRVRGDLLAITQLPPRCLFQSQSLEELRKQTFPVQDPTTYNHLSQKDRNLVFKLRANGILYSETRLLKAYHQALPSIAQEVQSVALTRQLLRNMTRCNLNQSSLSQVWDLEDTTPILLNI